MNAVNHGMGMRLLAVLAVLAAFAIWPISGIVWVLTGRSISDNLLHFASSVMHSGGEF